MRSVMLLTICLALTAASEMTLGAKPTARADLPAGWEARPLPDKGTSQFAVNTDQNAYYQLVTEPRDDFGANVDLHEWAKRVKENTAKTSKLEGRQDTELKARTVEGREVEEYEVTGEFKGIKYHFRSTMLRVGDCYCKMVFWTTPSHWDDAVAKFDELVGRLK